MRRVPHILAAVALVGAAAAVSACGDESVKHYSAVYTDNHGNQYTYSYDVSTSQMTWWEFGTVTDANFDTGMVYSRTTTWSPIGVSGPNTFLTATDKVIGDDGSGRPVHGEVDAAGVPADEIVRADTTAWQLAVPGRKGS